MGDAWAAFDLGVTRERFPIETAPKDGTLILVGDPDVGEFPMSWGHIQRNGLFPGKVGMWTMCGGSMTWNDDDGFGPTTWRPLDDTAHNTAPRGEAGDTAPPRTTIRKAVGEGNE